MSCSPTTSTWCSPSTGSPGRSTSWCTAGRTPTGSTCAGFIEQGTTTTPFDMVVKNQASRYHLVMDAINNARRTPAGASELKTWCIDQLDRHSRHVVEHLEDMPEVRDWTWQRPGTTQDQESADA